MSLSSITSTSSRAITAPPSLNLATDYHFSGDLLSSRITSSQQLRFTCDKDCLNPYISKGNWFQENFDPSAAFALQSTCSKIWQSSINHCAL